MSPHAVDGALETVRASGIPARRIEFEITETAMMSDFNQARRAIDKISQAGHSVALDDFGIGYSSLQYLQQLPVSKLKIDHSFVRSILEDTSSFKIVRTLLSLSHTLGLGCVVEGVMTVDDEVTWVDPLAALPEPEDDLSIADVKAAADDAGDVAGQQASSRHL